MTFINFKQNQILIKKKKETYKDGIYEKWKIYD